MINRFKQDLAQLGKPFLLVLLSEFATLSALMLGNVTLAWWIAQRGGAHDLAIHGSMIAAATLAAMPLLSPLGDRFPKKWLMTVGFLALAVESVVLAFLAQSNHYNLGLIIGCAIVGVAGIAVILPCMQTIAAELVNPDQVSLAISMQKVSGSLGGMVSPVIGGVLISGAGIASALWLYLALLVAAAVAAGRLPAVQIRERDAADPGAAGATRWMRELQDGLRIKWDVPLERRWTLINMIIGVFYSPAIGMLLALRITSLGLQASWLGAANMGLMAGMMIGFMGLAAVVTRRVGRFKTLIGSIWLRAATLVVIGCSASPVLLVAAFCMLGVSQAAIQFVGVTHRLLATPVTYRARSASVNIMTWQLSSTIGPTLAGIVLLSASVEQCYIGFGIAIALCTIAMTRTPQIREFLALSHESVTDWYGRRYPALFVQR